MDDKPKTLGDIIPEIEALLAWAKAHPDLPAPCMIEALYVLNHKETVAAIVRSVPRTEKHFHDDLATLTHTFDTRVRLHVIVQRDVVCVKNVVGKKQVAEQIIPAHEVEDVEWKCEPLLAPSAHAEPATA